MSRWYIEARVNESWREVSDLFGKWIESLGSVMSFGWSEGDSVVVNGATFLCFHIPDHHRDKVRLFADWASTTDRLFGEARSGKLHLAGRPDLVVLLPADKTVPLPPWLR
jgi:hypothetical protein